MAKRRIPQLNSPNSTDARARRQELQADSATRAGDAEKSAHHKPADECSGPPSMPTPGVRGLISLAIIFHGLCLLLALSSNLAPSYLQGRLLAVAGPYLHATHQYYHALPLELTRAEPLDSPLRLELQVETASSGSQQSTLAWQPLALGGLFGDVSAHTGVGDARWHNLGRWLSLIASADPESEILSDFAARAVQLAEKQSGERYQAVRLLSAKVLSYDEDLSLAGNLRDPADETFQPVVMYTAHIVRLDDTAGQSEAGGQRLSLIPAQDALRTAKPVDIAKELP